MIVKFALCALILLFVIFDWFLIWLVLSVIIINTFFTYFLKFPFLLDIVFHSLSQVLKVPISWDALVKLVRWLYSFELSKPATGCLWNGMASEEKIRQLEPYIELSWLAEYWLLEDLYDTCSEVVIYGLESDREISVHILKIAAGLSQWKLAEIATEYAAPSYRQLCESGELEGLDEAIVEMLRAASVRFWQESGN